MDTVNIKTIIITVNIIKTTMIITVNIKTIIITVNIIKTIITVNIKTIIITVNIIMRIFWKEWYSMVMIHTNSLKIIC